MKTIQTSALWVASLLVLGPLAMAQAPLAQPLADFDKLVADLKTGSVVGEPIRTGDTAVIPFGKIKFGLASGELMAGYGGSMGVNTVPLGVLIVEGDDVRAELFPEQEEKPSPLQEFVKAILDRKIVMMVNGLNIGNTSGNVQDLGPLLSAMTGQTTFMVNGLNLGNLNPPKPAATSDRSALPGELNKLFDARKYTEALALADSVIAKDPQNADAHVWKGRIMGSLAAGNPAGAMEEFEKALALDKNNPQAYYYLGEALQKKGLNEKAATAYKKALELQPNYPEASKALAATR